MPPEEAGQRADQLASDWRSVSLSKVDQALLEYSEQLTLRPGAIAETDVQSLRTVGLDDRAIHDLCAIIAYFAFANRIASGLGIELEE